MPFIYQKIKSPIGNIYLATDGEFLRILAMEENWQYLKEKFEIQEEQNHKILEKTKIQLEEYFLGKRKNFEIPLYYDGTDFQKKTWQALLKIHYGETINYSQQAEMIKNPKAVRAIGGTNGKNMISIIIPCHRVIGKSGKLTGYAGGLDAKAYLRALEAKKY